MIVQRELEIVTYRATFAMYFTDHVTDQAITDGLEVRAWRHDPANPRRVHDIVMATKSQNSALYGFRSLPGLERYQRGDTVAPGSIPYLVHIMDARERFLPQLRRFDLPLIAPSAQEIRLFPASTYVVPTGFGAVSGELVHTTVPVGVPPQVTLTGPASWAGVTVVLPPENPADPPSVRQGLADVSGRFSIPVPYLTVTESTLLSNASWNLTLTIQYSPTAIAADLDGLGTTVPGLAPAQVPAFQDTLDTQAPAALYETVTLVDAATQTYTVVGPTGLTEITVPLNFGQPQVLRTARSGAGLLSEFFIRSS